MCRTASSACSPPTRKSHAVARDSAASSPSPPPSGRRRRSGPPRSLDAQSSPEPLRRPTRPRRRSARSRLTRRAPPPPPPRASTGPTGTASSPCTTAACAWTPRAGTPPPRSPSPPRRPPAPRPPASSSTRSPASAETRSSSQPGTRRLTLPCLFVFSFPPLIPYVAGISFFSWQGLLRDRGGDRSLQGGAGEAQRQDLRRGGHDRVRGRRFLPPRAFLEGRFGVPFTTMGRAIIQPDSYLHPRYAEAKRWVHIIPSSSENSSRYHHVLATECGHGPSRGVVLVVFSTLRF